MKYRCVFLILVVFLDVFLVNGQFETISHLKTFATCNATIQAVKDLIGTPCSNTYSSQGCSDNLDKYGLFCCSSICHIQDRNSGRFPKKVRQGEQCKYDIQKQGNEFSYKCPGKCASGMICQEGLCVSFNLQERCSCVVDSDCWLNGIRPYGFETRFCINGQCRSLKDLGEPCVVGNECRSKKCLSGKCEALLRGETCTEDDQCGVGLVCQESEQTVDVCVNVTYPQLGDPCLEWEYECPYPLVCRENVCSKRPVLGEECRFQCLTDDLYCDGFKIELQNSDSFDFDVTSGVCKAKYAKGQSFLSASIPSAAKQRCLDEKVEYTISQNGVYILTCITKCCYRDEDCPLGFGPFKRKNVCVNNECLPVSAKVVRETSEKINSFLMSQLSDNQIIKYRGQTNVLKEEFPECKYEFENMYNLLVKYGEFDLSDEQFIEWPDSDQQKYIQIVCCVACKVHTWEKKGLAGFNCTSLKYTPVQPTQCSHHGLLSQLDWQCEGWIQITPAPTTSTSTSTSDTYDNRIRIFQSLIIIAFAYFLNF